MSAHHDNSEFGKFTNALKKVLRVSHSEMQHRLEAAKRKPKTSASGRASRGGHQKASS